METKGMAWVRILLGAVWLNSALEKLLNAHLYAVSSILFEGHPFHLVLVRTFKSCTPEISSQ